MTAKITSPPVCSKPRSLTAFSNSLQFACILHYHVTGTIDTTVQSGHHGPKRIGLSETWCQIFTS